MTSHGDVTMTSQHRRRFIYDDDDRATEWSGVGRRDMQTYRPTRRHRRSAQQAPTASDARTRRIVKTDSRSRQTSTEVKTGA